MELKQRLIRLGNQCPELRPFLEHILERRHTSADKEARRRVRVPKGRRSLFSNKAYTDIRRALGKKNVGEFLRFYRSLRRIYLGEDPPFEEGFYRTFRKVTKKLPRAVDEKTTKSMIKNLLQDAKRPLKRLDRLDDPTEDNRRSRRFYSKLINILGQLIKRAAREQEVYLNKKRLKRPGWIRFELMRPEEEKLEKYKEMDEDLYELEKEKNKLREKLNEKIEDEVRQAGLEPTEERVLNRPVIAGESKEGDLDGRGKKRGDDVWKLDEEMASRLNLDQLDGEATEIELHLGESDDDVYEVKDFKEEDGTYYLKTYNDIDSKEWGNCRLVEKEVWVYPEEGDVYTLDEFYEERKRRLDSMDKLSNVYPDDEELDEMRTYGTESYGKGRRGDVADHDLPRDHWVMRDKDEDFDPSNLLDDPQADVYLHLNDVDYDVVDYDIQYLDGETFPYVVVDREITEKSYGQYALQEGGNIVDRYAEDQEIEYRALSDDSDKQSSMTRIYPTVEIHGETVIAKGRYKGMVLDDMINEAGRMIEGVAYDYDPDQGRPVRLDNVPDRELKEPYISLNEDDELLLRIPSRNNYTDLRNKIRDLSDDVVDIKYIEGTRQSSYTFKPPNFRSIRRTLGSVAMTKAAREKIEAYFDRLAQQESKMDEENLERFSAERLGGFEDWFEDGGGFHQKQQEALAWLDGGSGLIGADTGTGKSLLAVGYIKDLMRRGVLESSSDKVLFLCPAPIQGNLESEIINFVDDDNVDEVLQHVETMTYGSFAQRDIDPENPDIQEYEAVICDEASEAKNRTTKTNEKLRFEHPRKAFMTASPMEGDPDDLYNLVATSNDWDLNSSEGLKKRRKFKKRYTEKIGSRSIGVTQDPRAREDLVDWMADNMFHIDKTEMQEVDLPSLNQTADGISMPEEVEEEYRDLAEDAEETFRRMTALYRDKDEDAYAPEVTGARVRLADLFSKLTTLANEPEEVIDGMDRNPKLDRSIDLIKEDIDNRTRTLLWTDDPELAEKSARYLSEDLPGMKHAFGTQEDGEVGIYKNGEKVDSFTRRVYEHPDSGKRVDPEKWRQFVSKYYIKPTRSGVMTFTLTQSWSKGFNLQPFSKVIHLDRDNWKSENMKQRTARSWRQGQDDQVDEITLDMTFGESKDEYDRTLDEIGKFIQEMEEDLFNALIKDVQDETPGASWFGMDKDPAEKYQAERDLLELLSSPYLDNQAEIKKKLQEKGPSYG